MQEQGLDMTSTYMILVAHMSHMRSPGSECPQQLLCAMILSQNQEMKVCSNITKTG